MSVPQEAIRELQAIHQRLTGEYLTEAAAQAMAGELFRLFLGVYEPIPTRWFEELADRNNDLAHNP
jgi:hypothetical protein